MRGKALPHLEISRGAICRVGLAGLTRETEDRRVVGYPAEWVIRGKREVKGISAFPLIISHASPKLDSLSLSLGNVGFTEPS